MLEDSGTPLVLTRAALLPLLPECATGGEVRAVCVDCGDGLDGAGNDGKDTDPPMISRPHDLAYCIYTSGSTGDAEGRREHAPRPGPSDGMDAPPLRL